MQGTNQIVFMLFIGYIVFTTMRGNLRKWLQVIGLREETTRETILSGNILRGQK
jgi:hypothetical protein